MNARAVHPFWVSCLSIGKKTILGLLAVIAYLCLSLVSLAVWSQWQAVNQAMATIENGPSESELTKAMNRHGVQWARSVDGGETWTFERKGQWCELR